MAGLSGGGLSDLTKQQRVMAKSFSPANNNAQNMQDISIRPDSAGVVKAEDSVKTKEQSKGQQAPEQQGRTSQPAANIPQVAALMGNLGIFSQHLQAKVNSFVNSAPASAANVGLQSGGVPVWDAATGQWKAVEAKVGANAEGLLQEKLGDQQALRDQASEIFTDGKPKSFEEVLKKFGDANRDGVLDAQEQQWVNEAFDIANGVRRLKQTRDNPAQYEALLSQLISKDKNGLVSGIMSALDQYESIVGMKVTGADADAYYLRDLLNMGEDTMRQEVQKALTQSSGLFGADYEAYVKREVDKSASQYNDAAREDATVMQQLKETSKTWLMDFEKQFEGARTQLNSMFKGASDSLIKELDMAAIKTGNKGIEQAKQWFVDTQTLTTVGGKDFGKVIFQALVDSKLGAEPKKILKKWLGRTIGEDVAEKGVLANLLDKITSTGYFWTENAAGQQVQVSFNAEQKMEAVRLMNDPNMTDKQKSAALESVIEQASQGMSGRLDTDMNKVTEPITSGKLEQGLNMFKGAMVNSMSGFDKSLVQTGYSAAVSSLGRGVDPKAMQAAIEVKAQQKLDEINAAYAAAKQAVEAKSTQIAADVEKMKANVQAATALNERGVQSVLTNYQNAIGNYAGTAMARENVADPVTGTTRPMSRLEVAYQNAVLADLSARGAQLNAANFSIPADINSEKYAKPYATLLVMKNLASMDSPVYEALARDYFGGVPGLSAAINNPSLIFNKAEGNTYMAIAGKAMEAFRDVNFGKSIWDTTNNSKAINDKLSSNNEGLVAAQQKLAEAVSAQAQLATVMAQAQAQLKSQTRDAQARVQAQAASMPQQVAAPQAVGGSPFDIRSHPDFVNAERAMQQAETNMRNGGGDRATLENAFRQAQANFMEVSNRLRSAPQAAAPQAGGAPTGASYNGAPLTADISRETANNMFNQALDGQSMGFTAAPQVDLDAIRNAGNIQYVNRAAGLDPSGLDQYAGEKWAPADSEKATSMPLMQTGAKTPVVFGPAQETRTPDPTPVPAGNPNRRGEGETPEKEPRIVKITPTDNPSTVIVTTSDGKQSKVNAPAGTLMDPQGGLEPMYPPKGMIPDNERLASDPLHPDNVAKGSQATNTPPAQPGALERVWENIKSSFRVPFTGPTADETAEKGAVAALEKQEKKLADAGVSDATFGVPPQRSEPAYVDAYNKKTSELTANEERRGKGADNVDADNGDAGDQGYGSRTVGPRGSSANPDF
jgi:hypothetical protein